MNEVRKIFVAAFAALCVLGLVTAHASTIISGETSGTWDPSGNPYIIATYSWVDNGESLDIEPGVEVVMGQDVEFKIDGVLKAMGTYNDPITFRGTTSSNYWERIFINYRGGEQCEFNYCQFLDAKVGLYLYNSLRDVLETKVENCQFSNCINSSIYGRAQHYSYPYVRPLITSCTFEDGAYGCFFEVYDSYAYAEPILIGNIFRNLSEAAVAFKNPGYAPPSIPVFVNNVVSNCSFGVDIQDDHYDVEIINNIFVGCGTGVSRANDNSMCLDVEYNCFFNNTAGFSGYPSTYGQVVWANDNGDASDLFYNIYMDPEFEPGSFELSASSPCIDAGDPTIEDYFYPAPGTLVSDMGAYGGEEPGAGVPPAPPVIVSQPQSQKVFLGQDVTFDVEAAGAGLSYQWYFSGAALSDETTDTLDLTAVDFDDAGNYYVTVSNQYDVVTSSIANLRVTEIGLEIEMHAGLHMTNLVVGTDYSVQAVYSLSDTNWFEIDTFEATSDNDVWYDSEAAGQKRYYQVISQP